jgi:hypothetical protein
LRQQLGTQQLGENAMIDWANEELAVFQGHLTFLKLGSARIFRGQSGGAEVDVTLEYIALIERHIDEWTALMARHNIAVYSPMPHEMDSRRAA